MGQQAGKLADGYKPVGVPKALKAIQGRTDSIEKEKMREMEVVIVDRPEMRLLAIHCEQSGHTVRSA